MPTVAGLQLSSFWPFDTSLSFLGGNAGCGDRAAFCNADLKKDRQEDSLAAPKFDTAYQNAWQNEGASAPCLSPTEQVLRTSTTQSQEDAGGERLNTDRDVEEVRREAVRLREALQRAEEKLETVGGAGKEQTRRFVRRQYYMQQDEIIEVLGSTPVEDGSVIVPVDDHLSITAPASAQQRSSLLDADPERALPATSLLLLRPQAQYPSHSQVETLAAVAADEAEPGHISPVQSLVEESHLPRAGSMREDESQWRVRHIRCDNAKMPTALRAQPDGTAPPLQDVHAAPLEEVLLLQSQKDHSNSTVVWSKIVCAQGEGWMKRQHLKEGGWRMRHKRGDNASIPTALREKPTATSKPLQAVKIEANEEVLVHCLMEVQEGGRATTWARVACALGEGWVKREHLREVQRAAPKALTPSPPDEEGETQSAAASSPRSRDGSFTPPLPIALASVAASSMQSRGSRAPRQAASTSPLQSKMSTVAGSEYPASGVRIRLGTLEFLSNSVGSIGMFDTVSFRASVQLGGSVADDGPPARWLDAGPHTEARSLKYSRSVSDEGRYSAKCCCVFDEALDLPWPPPSPAPEKIAVDVWLERTSVVDRFDRVLGGLGLHNPAGLDRRWLGRAVADLPPEGVDDVPYAWSVEGGGALDCPVPSTMRIGVEWVFQPLEEL
mmetsp:Transcript_11253/g.18649  ORF Transcript_11253/g.18649 Transcript_11253/m.18649 type:complete len:667 (-) Transcript_11253:50-2050(-)